jgi:hypothetical protein
MKAAVIMDMHGCPNRCRHCWLGHHNNADIPVEDFIRIAEQFKSFTRDGRPLFSELIFNTWYREPDFSDSYRELWELENRLSTGKVLKYELASTWRLVRDPGYALWLRELGVNCVQVTLFGTDKNTDYFKGRKGAFSESLEAIDIMLENGIIPRIQIFPFTTTVEDIFNLRQVLLDIRLEEWVNSLGKEFACFLNTATPIGEGFNLEEIRPRKNDLLKLPQYFIEKTLKHWKSESIDNLWKTEAELMPSLLDDDNPLNENPEVPAFMIDSEFNVYPNCGEIAAWWCLGNIRRDGVPVIIENYLTRNNPGLNMNYEIPVSYFARKYGNPAGDRIYARSDLIQKWIRLEGMGGR